MIRYDSTYSEGGRWARTDAISKSADGNRSKAALTTGAKTKTLINIYSLIASANNETPDAITRRILPGILEIVVFLWKSMLWTASRKAGFVRVLRRRGTMYWLTNCCEYFQGVFFRKAFFSFEISYSKAQQFAGEQPFCSGQYLRYETCDNYFSKYKHQESLQNLVCIYLLITLCDCFIYHYKLESVNWFYSNLETQGTFVKQKQLVTHMMLFLCKIEIEDYVR